MCRLLILLIIIRYNVGDQVTIEYKEGEKSNTVLSLTEVKTIQ